MGVESWAKKERSRVQLLEEEDDLASSAVLFGCRELLVVAPGQVMPSVATQKSSVDKSVDCRFEARCGVALVVRSVESNLLRNLHLVLPVRLFDVRESAEPNMVNSNLAFELRQSLGTHDGFDLLPIGARRITLDHPVNALLGGQVAIRQRYRDNRVRLEPILELLKRVYFEHNLLHSFLRFWIMAACNALGCLWIYLISSCLSFRNAKASILAWPDMF